MIGSDAAFNFGVGMAKVALAVSDEELNFSVGLVDTVFDDPSGALQRMLAQSAASLYKMAGRQDLRGFHLYDRLADQYPWYEELNCFVEPVLDAYAKVKVAEDLVKAAEGGVISDVVQPLGSLLSDAGPAIWNVLGSAAVLTGGSLGATNWALRRHMEEDDKDAEEIQAKIDYYNRVTQDIETGLARKGL